MCRLWMSVCFVRGAMPGWSGQAAAAGRLAVHKAVFAPRPAAPPHPPTHTNAARLRRHRIIAVIMPMRPPCIMQAAAVGHSLRVAPLSAGPAPLYNTTMQYVVSMSNTLISYLATSSGAPASNITSLSVAAFVGTSAQC